MNRISLRIYAGLCFVFLVVAGAVTRSDLFLAQEFFFNDRFMRLRPPLPTAPEIVIVEISDDTLSSLGVWPLPRAYHAALIEALLQFGARSIVFDILFSEPGEDDAQFARSIEEAGNVYLPRAFRLQPHGPRYGTSPAIEIAAGLQPSLAAAARGIGHINVSVDPDGKLRRLPLLVQHGSDTSLSLALLVALHRMELDAEQVRVSPEALTVANRRIPLDRDGAILLNYPGPWNKTFVHVSYADVLKSAVDLQEGRAPRLDPGILEGAVCFVGLTATGTADLRATPFDTSYPLVGAQASLLNSMLSGSFIARLSPPLRLACNAVIFALALLICLRLAPFRAFVACLGIALLSVAGAWVLFVKGGLFTDVFLPLCVIAVVYVSVLLAKFFEEVQRRRILEKELEIAAAIQRSFLPAGSRQRLGLEIDSYLSPAKFVAGDFYDLIELDEDTVGLFIGDVCGKGVSAALIMAQAISLLREAARLSRDPATVLSFLNDALVPVLKGRFVTGQYLVVDARDGSWAGASAGHCPALSFHADRETASEILSVAGPPLGLVPNVTYASVRSRLSAGEGIFLYTDGWTESRNRRNEELGTRVLKDWVIQARRAGMREFFPFLLEKLNAFVHAAPQHDDVTALVLKYRGQPF